MDLKQFLDKEGPAAISPDFLFPDEIVDVSKMNCLRPHFDEFRQGAAVKKNLALLRQRRIGMTTRRLEHFQSPGGMRKVAAVDPELFWEICMNYGGLKAWTDPEMRADTLRRHPEMAVPVQSRRLTLLVNGRKTAPQNPAVGGRNGAGSRTRPADAPLILCPA
jgi:hypothetical protein